MCSTTQPRTVRTSATSAQLRQVGVGDAAALERCGESAVVELRMAA
jgi:hypothetical protein